MSQQKHSHCNYYLREKIEFLSQKIDKKSIKI